MKSLLKEKINKIIKIKKKLKGIKDNFKIIEPLIILTSLITTTTIVLNLDLSLTGEVIFGTIFGFFMSSMVPLAIFKDTRNKDLNNKILEYTNRFGDIYRFKRKDIEELLLLLEDFPKDDKESLIMLLSRDRIETTESYVSLMIHNEIKSEKKYTIELFKKRIEEVKEILNKKEIRDLFMVMLQAVLLNMSRDDFFKEKNNLIEISSSFGFEIKKYAIDALSNKLDNLNDHDKSKIDMENKIDILLKSENIENLSFLKNKKEVFLVKSI